MNFELTEDQRQLRDSVERVLADHYSFEARRAIARTETSYSNTVWKHFVELGLTALPIPEAYGGFGGSAVDLLPVMEEFGKALVLEPYVASIVLGATALRLSEDDEQCKALLPEVATGERLLSFAHDEVAGRHAPLWVETTACYEHGSWVIRGVKSNVLHGQFADCIVVSARIQGAPTDRKGLALFLVDSAATGLGRRGFQLVDDTSAAELTFNATKATRLEIPDAEFGAFAAIEGTIQAGVAALCAQAVGAMQSTYALTLSYLNTRQQFGRTIGQNQALRHRAAEMLVSLETGRSMAMLAAIAVNSSPSAQTVTDLIRAKLLIGRHGRTLCQHAIQLHGGIGVTEEYAVGHYLRRVTVIDQLFGDEQAQMARLAAALAV